MPTVQEIADQIVAREGGYANDPADPGGPTNHGVTLATLRRFGTDTTGDGTVGIADLKALSPQAAAQIFVEHYFRAPKLDRLPAPLQADAFDFYVNAGANAVRVLQGLFGQMGLDCAVDGLVGPQTVAVAARAMAEAPDHLADAYGIARRNWYYALADRRPASRKYARRRDGGKGGWITRAEEFISPRYRLTEAQHEARTAAWA